MTRSAPVNRPGNTTARPRDAEPALRPLKRSLPMTLLRAREAVMERFRDMLRHNGLTEQQWRVIRVLADHESLEVSQLAAHSFLLPPSLSRILKFLSGKRLIRRRAVNDDQRRFEVSLTAAGRGLFRKVAPSSEAIYRDLEQAFGEQRLEQLYTLLSDLERTIAVSRNQAGTPVRPAAGRAGAAVPAAGA